MNDISIPEIRVGDPVHCGALAVFPLFAERTLFPSGTLNYLLSDEAQEAGTCTVREVSEAGVVGQLLVENTGERPVLFVEGEELCGAKQNRVMQTSVLIGAKSQVVVPVYCVEHGRWDNSPTSLKTGSHCPPSLRHLLKRGGTGISRRGDGQAAVWRFIQARHRATGTCSPKENMTDTLRSHPEVVEGLRRNLRYPEGASGIAVAMNGKTVGLDLLDKSESLRKLWDRLVVLGLTLDALDVRDTEPSDSDISVRLYKVRKVRWQRVESVGLGETYRATEDDDSLAMALVVDGTLLHLSLSMPMGD